MRVQFKSEGGFAYLPGLNRPFTVDTGELSPEEAGKLERLVEEAEFFELPPASEPPRGGADLRSYSISVSSSARSHTVRTTEPIENPRLRALIDHLEEKARESRAAPRDLGSS